MATTWPVQLEYLHRIVAQYGYGNDMEIEARIEQLSSPELDVAVGVADRLLRSQEDLIAYAELRKVLGEDERIAADAVLRAIMPVKGG